MNCNFFASDFKDIIFDNFNYTFIHELYSSWGVRTFRIQVEHMVSGISTNSPRSYLKVQIRMFDEDGSMINKATETDVPVRVYPRMADRGEPLVGFLSVKKLLQRRSMFKIDTHPNQPKETNMNQGVTRRVQASTNSQGNVQFKKPDNIRVVNTVEVNEGPDRMWMKKGDNHLVISNSQSGRQKTISFDLLETFYHAAKNE